MVYGVYVPAISRNMHEWSAILNACFNFGVRVPWYNVEAAKSTTNVAP